MVPGLSVPDGSRMVAPTSCTVLEAIEVAGATPGCSDSRSVKLRPFSGTAAICRALITWPSCVLLISMCRLLSVTLTVWLMLPTSRTASRVRAAPVSSTMSLRW